MTAQEYILSRLEEIKDQVPIANPPQTDQEMVAAVFKLLMSKKYRKYSVPEKNQRIILEAVEKNITNKEAIKIAWPFGGYKLWRLEESPEADWAELFSIMYIAKWLKPVCALYPQGVEFVYWFDEVVIGRMNNIPQSDLDAYKKSFVDLLSFLKPWLPENLHVDIFLERDQYESGEAFEIGLEKEMAKLAQAKALDPQPLSETAIRSIEMNVKLTPEQEQDPAWREKVDLMHYAYYNLQEQQSRVRPAYTTANITAFTTLFEPNVIPVGSAKTSIVRFWVGVGALEQREDGYIEAILSITQLEKAKYTWESIAIPGLVGRNFHKIRVISEGV